MKERERSRLVRQKPKTPEDLEKRRLQGSLRYQYLNIFSHQALSQKSSYSYSIVALSINLWVLSDLCNQSLFNQDEYKGDSSRDKKRSENDKTEGNQMEDKEHPKMTSKDMQLTIMLLSVTFALIIFTLPMNIRYILFIIVYPWQSERTYAIYQLIYHVSQKLYFINNAINFYLHCVSGSKFRNDLQVLICGSNSSREDHSISSKS